MRNKSLFILLILCFQLFGLKAFQLNGSITDTKGNKISYASVYIANSTYGVSSNYNGDYYIELAKGTYDIVFEAIGYVSDTVNIYINSNHTYNISLKDLTVELGTIDIVLDGEDPAYPIIRKAIEYRKSAHDKLESFTCNSYIKSSIEQSLKNQTFGGTSKINFIESYSKVNVRLPNQIKEEIIAYNDFSDKSNNVVSAQIDFGSDYDKSSNTATNPDLFYTHYSDAQFNFYDNQLFEDGISPIPLTSPISNSAFLSYRYELQELFYIGSTPIYKIKVLPKRENGALFSGMIYVEGNTYSLSKIELSVNSQVLSYYSNFKIIQEYQLIDSISLPINREFHFTIENGNKIKAGITKVIHKNYLLNPNFTKNYFNNALYITNDNAYDFLAEDWDSIRPISLKESESLYVHKKDSIKRFENSPKYLDSLDKEMSELSLENIFLSGLIFKNRSKGLEYSIDPLINSIHPFSVGGYRHSQSGGVSKEWSKAHKLELNGELSFGFKNLDLKGELQTKFTYLPKKFAKIMVKGGNTFDIVTFSQNISNIFARSNFVEKRFFGFGHEIEIINGLFFDFETEYAQVNSIEGYTLSDWSNSIFPENTPQPFDTYNELFLDLNIAIRPFQKYYLEPYKKVIVGSDYPQIDIHLKKGIPNLFNSIVDFDYLELKVKDDIQLSKLGNSKYRIRIGSFITKNQIRLLDYKYFRGSDRFFFSDPLNTFQLLGPTMASSNSFFHAHYVHHFNGFFLNQIPLIKHLKMGTVGGAGILMLDQNNFKHAEIYSGLEKDFRIRKQKYKLSVFYVVSDSNHSQIDSGIKVGIDMYNFLTRSWSY